MMKEPDLISNMRETTHQPSNIEKLKRNTSKPDLQNKSNNTNNNNNNNLTNVANSNCNNTKNDTDKRLKYTFGVNQYEFPDKIKVLKCHNQIKELHTVLRDRETSHSDFKFYSDRLVGKKAKENKYSILYYHKFLKSNLLD
jgi:hypothetical protein